MGRFGRGRGRAVGALISLGALLGLVLIGLPPASAQTANDILVPSGYQVGVFASGFTAATAMDRAPNGDLYVLDSGSNFGFDANGPQPVVKIWKVPAAGGSPVQVYSNDKQPGLKTTALGIAVKDDDNIFVNDGVGLNRVRRDGSVQHLLDLPVQGDHNADHIAIGKDGMLYWGQGSATNAGVVGEDNYNATGWLKVSPTYHDIPCKDVTLSGQNFTTGNPITGDKTLSTVTGAYMPFGTPSTPGQVVKGAVPCTSSVLRAKTDGTGLEMFAWGFRNPYALQFAPDDSPLKGALVVANNGADVRGSRPLEADGDDLYVVSQGSWFGFPDVFDEQPVTEARFSPDPKTSVAPLLFSPDRSNAVGAIDHFQKGTSSDGFAFSTSDDFGWKNDAFITEWGALGFGAQPAQGLPGFNVIHIHFSWTSSGVFAGTSNSIFLGNRIQGGASTNGLNGLEHPIDIRFSADGKTMYVLDYGAAGKTGSGKIWAVTRTGTGAPGSEAPAAAAAPPPTPAPAAVPTPAPTPAPAAPAPAAAPAPGGTTVVAQNFSFTPADVTVAAGVTVTWTNPDSVAHTVTWDDRSVDSGLFQPGQTFQYTFTEAGTYTYFCIPHGSPGAGMHGSITVTGG